MCRVGINELENGAMEVSQQQLQNPNKKVDFKINMGVEMSQAAIFKVSLLKFIFESVFL